MPDFAQAHAVLGPIEGGYSNNPADLGGETYCGISRVFHPTWAGWALIDAVRPRPKQGERLQGLDTLVARFYEVTFWEPCGGAALPSQALAAEVYEQAVNLSPGAAVQHLQRALNVMNRGGADWPDIRVDGRMGGATLAAVQRCITRRGEPALLKCLNAYQAMHYLREAERRPSQETFLNGWLTRT